MKMSEKIDIYEVDAGNIFKETLVQGKGALIVPGALVFVHYTGTLSDGTEFDSSRNRFGTFKLIVGLGHLIKGLDIGICSMKRGERSVLTIDSKYAFGAEGNPPIIPPHATLKYEVEILDWRYEDSSPKHDGTIEKRIVTKKGDGYSNPTKGNYVEVHINGKFHSKEVEDRDLTFCLGQGKADQVAEGIELALENFKAGEKSTVFMDRDHVVDVPYFEEVNKAKYGFLEYELELKRFEREPSSWSLDENDLIQQAEMFKAKGNQIFQNKDYPEAIKMYKKMLEYLEPKAKRPFKSELFVQLLVKAYSNLALCYLKVDDNESAKDMAYKAINFDPDNDKGHYRCAMALFKLSDFETAKDHLEICLKIDPDNVDAKAQLSSVQKSIRNVDGSERELYRSMFERMASVGLAEQEGANRVT